MRKRNSHPNRWTVRRLCGERMLEAHVRPDVVVREVTARLPALPAMHVWQVLRLLQLWLSAPENERDLMFVADGMVELEETILLSEYDQRLRDPLAVILACLRPTAPTERLGWACICAAEWAALTEFPRVLLAFAFGAAYAADSPRYYMVAELAAVNIELSELPPHDPEGSRSRLQQRRRELAQIIASDGAFVSFARI